MNSNAVIAILVLRGVITEEEGQMVVDFIHDKPQSTILRDAVADVSSIIGKKQPEVKNVIDKAIKK